MARRNSLLDNPIGLVILFVACAAAAYFVPRGLAERRVIKLHNAGVERFNAEDYSGAVDEFKKVLVVDPENEAARTTMAKCYVQMAEAPFEKGDYARARGLYELAVEKDPDVKDAYHNLAFIYLNDGMDEKALAAVERAVEEHPDDPKVQILRDTARKRVSGED